MQDDDDDPDGNPGAADFQHRFGLIAPKTLAKVLGVNLMTLKLWRMEDRGPNYVRVGRRVWYLYDDVLTWMEEMRTMTSQRRDYSKMTPHEADIVPPGAKISSVVEHQPVPPPTSDDVNAPPRDPKYSPDGTPDHPPPLEEEPPDAPEDADEDDQSTNEDDDPDKEPA